MGSPWKDRRLWIQALIIALSIIALVRQIREVEHPPELTGERHDEEP